MVLNAFQIEQRASPAKPVTAAKRAAMRRAKPLRIIHRFHARFK